MKFLSFCKKHISDILAIGITSIVVIAMFIGNIFWFPKTAGDKVEVYYQNKLVDSFDIKVDRVITFCRDKSAEGFSCDYTDMSDFQGPVVQLQIKDGSIKIEEETSKRKLCSIQGSISVSNTPIICLPNSFMAVITGKSDAEFDN